MRHRYIERRTPRHVGADAARRFWEIYDTEKAIVVATGMRLWAAAHKADRMNLAGAA